MKAIFYFILGVVSVCLINQNISPTENENNYESGISTQQLLQPVEEQKAVVSHSNKTVENYLLKYLSNYTTKSPVKNVTTQKTKYSANISTAKPPLKTTYSTNKYQAAQPTEPIEYYQNSFGETVQSPTQYTGTPAGATAICWDGTYSFSRSRRGTCSRHGGVMEWL